MSTEALGLLHYNVQFILQVIKLKYIILYELLRHTYNAIKSTWFCDNYMTNYKHEILIYVITYFNTLVGNKI